jgi:hypothetical protein
VGYGSEKNNQEKSDYKLVGSKTRYTFAAAFGERVLYKPLKTASGMG